MDRKTCAYGTVRNYRKIDIYTGVHGVWRYACSTTWARTCREARSVYAEKHNMRLENVKCYFAKD